MKRWLLILILAIGMVHAKEAAPLAADEAVEKKMVAISEELRCLVCQNESLASSHAELAADLRFEIRNMIKEGKSNEQIMEFMVTRYGDFVRYRPPLKGTTLLLWFGPGLLLAIALISLVRYLRRRNLLINDAPLSEAEQQKINQLNS